MNEKIDEAIGILVGKIRQPTQPVDAIQYSQAALNLANMKLALGGYEKHTTEKHRTKGAGS